MAINESVAPMDNDLKFATLRFALRHKAGQTLAQRLYVQIEVEVNRDDGREPRLETVEIEVSDSEIATFAAGDAAALRTLLGKAYNHASNVALAPK